MNDQGLQCAVENAHCLLPRMGIHIDSEHRQQSAGNGDPWLLPVREQEVNGRWFVIRPLVDLDHGAAALDAQKVRFPSAHCQNLICHIGHNPPLCRVGKVAFFFQLIGIGHDGHGVRSNAQQIGHRKFSNRGDNRLAKGQNC